MVKNKSMTIKQNHDNDDDYASFSRKGFKTFDNGDVAPWSELNNDVLYLVMMQLGFIQFLAFSGVCKSWRSFALFNRNAFLASQPPMSIRIELRDYKDSYCYLEDFERRRYRTIIPHSAGRTCYGVTCGYLILFGRETRDFWLVNPITRHELHFPDYPLYVGIHEERIRAVLVFLPSISGWVLVVLLRKISFCIAGKQGWNHVSFTLPTSYICDLHAFKGKIYTLNNDSSLRELRLNMKRKRKWTLLETNNFSKLDFIHPQFVSSGENLYVKSRYLIPKKVLELDIGKMKLVSPSKTIGEYLFFLSSSKYCGYSAAIKLRSWTNSLPLYISYDYFLTDDKNPQCIYYLEWMWYFPHDCLTRNVILEDE